MHGRLKQITAAMATTPARDKWTPSRRISPVGRIIDTPVILGRRGDLDGPCR